LSSPDSKVSQIQAERYQQMCTNYAIHTYSSKHERLLWLHVLPLTKIPKLYFLQAFETKLSDEFTLQFLCLFFF